MDELRPTPTQIAAARALIGWSQGDLAREAGVSVPTVARYESRARAITQIAQVAAALEAEGIVWIGTTGVDRPVG